MRRKFLAKFEKAAYLGRNLNLVDGRTFLPVIVHDWVECLQQQLHNLTKTGDAFWYLVSMAAPLGAVNTVLFLMERAMAHVRKYGRASRIIMPTPSQILVKGSSEGQMKIVQLAIRMGARNYVQGMIEASTLR